MAKVTQSTPVKDMVINQGEDYRFQLNLYTGTSVTDKQVLDITGFSFTCKVRDEATDDDPALTAICTILDAPNGQVEFHFKADDSDGIDVDGSNYKNLTEYTYDVFMKYSNGDETRILCGSVYISPSVSNR